MLNILCSCTTLVLNFCPVISSHSSRKQLFLITVGNSVDSDQMASSEPSDLDLQCFQKRINTGKAG